jgi:hypothetical protein
MLDHSVEDEWISLTDDQIKKVVEAMDSLKGFIDKLKREGKYFEFTTKGDDSRH